MKKNDRLSDGGCTANVYSSDGMKLRTEHISGISAHADALSAFAGELGEQPQAASGGAAVTALSGQTTTEYHGPAIFIGGKVNMLLFPGGYTNGHLGVGFNYYTQDYLGNNRAVIKGSGTIEQTIAYYPYGGVIPDLGNPTGGQPFKFGGKELITANGLNEYDFGARRYYQAVPHFTSIDRRCEKYYWLSPYLFCANNPVNLVDPTGNIVIGLDEEGRQNILYTLTEEEAQFVKFDDEGKIDVDILNKSSSVSANMTALKTVVNSDITYFYATASQYSSNGEINEMFSGSEQGVVGVTLIPEAEKYPSPDENVHVYTSNKLSSLGQVENAAHELYGHSYFYDLKCKGHDVNPFHTGDVMKPSDAINSESLEINEPIIVFIRKNDRLENYIKIVSNQAINNYKSRIK